MYIKTAKIVSLASIILLGLLLILSVWGVIDLGEITAKIAITLGIIFGVSVFIIEIFRKDLKK